MHVCVCLCCLNRNTLFCCLVIKLIFIPVAKYLSIVQTTFMYTNDCVLKNEEDKNSNLQLNKRNKTKITLSNELDYYLDLTLFIFIRGDISFTYMFLRNPNCLLQSLQIIYSTEVTFYCLINKTRITLLCNVYFISNQNSTHCRGMLLLGIFKL